MGENKKKKEKNKQKNKQRLETLYNFFKKHWCWYTIIISFPTIWFSAIVPYWGVSLSLVDENNQLTKNGMVITSVLALIVLVIVFLNNLYLSKTETGKLERLSGEVEYLSTIMDNVDKICDEKYSRLKNKILEAKTTSREKAKIISDPNNQLRRIIAGITECLVKLLNNSETSYTFKDFFVTLTYNFPQDTKTWKWTEGTIEKDMDLESLLDVNSKSTFNYLLQSNKPYYFNNKKEDASRDRKYMYNPQDELSEENGEIIGSIFCYRYQVRKSGTIYIDAMLSISTQKKRFAKDEKEACNNVRDNMVSLVKDSFGKRIGIELSLLYLEFLQKMQK